jgi:REP element-mobilizing transposase RayT
MIRGIEGSPIVSDDHDRAHMVERLGQVSKNTGTAVYAWALMTNHVHMLVRSGPTGLSDFMRKLLTGYAIRYNRRHQRHGYLFQNRYKSIVCQEDRYFQKLVGYIHLNPYRAGLVHSLEELDTYKWSGHSVLMSRIRNDWQDRDYVLSCFGETEGAARQSYMRFVEEQSSIGHQPELVGGGLIRSIGGWAEVKTMRNHGEKQLGDERILGDGDFVSEMLTDAGENRKGLLRASELKQKAEEELERQCQERGLSRELVKSGSRQRAISKLRKEIVGILVREFGLTQAETARMLGISTSAVAGILNATP